MRTGICRGRLIASAALMTATAVVAGMTASGATALPIVDPTVAPMRAVEPIVMSGADFPGIAVPQNETAKAPFTDLLACQPGANTDQCAHNEYSPPEVDTSGIQGQLPLKGVYPSQLLGYRWDSSRGRFVQIPFQVDKVFTRYLENDAVRIRDLLGR